MPIAKADELIIAIAESPLILLFDDEESFSNTNAEIIIIGKAKYIGVKFAAAPIAIAPKPT